MLKTVGFPSARSGDQTIIDGNLVIGTAGKGIDFSADPSAPGMTSELLDDYEEGTWTPELRFSGATTGITYAVRYGTYTKVGRLITAYCKIDLTSKGSASGVGEIYGLPVTLPTPGISVPVSVWAYNLSYSGMLNFHAEGTTDRIALMQLSTGGSLSYLSDGNFTNGSAIEISISYMV
jgi:hypothetical protein